MPDHLEPSQHLKPMPEHRSIFATFVGQAHIAGTGPEGHTCRECVFWGVLRHNKAGGGTRIEGPGHFAASNKEKPGALKKARCNYEIRGKAARRFPHHAPAYRFFKQNDNPPLPVKADDPAQA